MASNEHQEYATDDRVEQGSRLRVLLMRPLDVYNYQEMPDLGLGYLAAVARAHGHKVSLLLKTSGLSDEQFLAHLVDFQPDIIGIKVFGSSVSSTRKAIKLAKSFDANITTVVGGAQPSGSDDILDYIDSDYAFQGEAEIGFPILLDNLRNSDKNKGSNCLHDIPGLVWRDGNGATVCNAGAQVADLDELPFPAWDLMEPRDFSRLPFGATFRGFPIAPIIFTRGCPFRCTFCQASTINGLGVRMRSVDSILEEMKMLVNEYGVREFKVYDSNCALNKDFLITVCKRIIEEKLEIHWACPNGVRLNSLDEEVLHWMKRSGCYQVNVGIESGSPRVLKLMRKSLSVEQIGEKVGLAHRAGINVVGFFMFGYPTETRAEMQMTVDLANSLPLHSALFGILMPLPGTELYRQLETEGKLGAVDWDTYDARNFENEYSELSAAELQSFTRKVFLRYNLRPKRVMGILFQLRSIRNLWMIIAYLIRYFVFRSRIGALPDS